MKKLFILFALAWLISSPMLAQQSLKKLVVLGDEALAARHYQTAIQYYLLAQPKAPANAKVKYQLAESYRQTFAYAEAEKYYQQVLDLNSKEYPLALFYLALTRKMNSKYEQAKQTFDEFIAKSDTLEFVGKVSMVTQAKLEKEGCDLAIEKSSLPFRSFGLTLLPSPINTAFNDYAAYTYLNDSSIVVTSGRAESVGNEAESSFGEDFTDFFRFNKVDTSWVPLVANDDFYKTNDESHEGSGSFNHNRTKYYYTRCEGPECAIFVTKLENGKWQPGQRLNDNVNPKGTESKHPSLNLAGDTLFFVSNRTGTVGQNDIYFSTKQADEQWGPAKNMGEKINTPWNEGSPFYFSKENILVISSQGHAGYGGFDIFLVKDPFGNPTVENIGKPFNSEVDELYFMAGNKKGYLSSNRPGGVGNFDLYNFDIRSDESMIAAVNREDSVGGKTAVSLLDANAICIDGLKVEGSDVTAITGKFESIYFDFDKATLRPGAEKTLQDLAHHCKSNPAIQIEIDGFADATGSDEYNNKLSFRRGMSTFNYLIKLGMDRSSLVVIAKGESTPAAPNSTAAGRQLNRRVEFIVKGRSLSPVARNDISPVGTRKYIVKKGDTVFSISVSHHMTVERFMELNSLSSNTIHVGQKVNVEEPTNELVRNPHP